MSREDRRISNIKQNAINEIDYYPSGKSVPEGDMIISHPKGRQLTLYKKSKGALWKVALSMDGNQFVDKDLDVKGSATIAKNLNIEGTVISKGLFTVYATSDSSDWIAKFLDSGGSTVAGFYQDADADGTLYIYDSSDNVDVLLRAQDGSYIRNKVTIGSATGYSNSDLTLDGGGALMLKETTTPTADADYGKIYTKNNNKLYFQTGAGVEKEISFEAL